MESPSAQVLFHFNSRAAQGQIIMNTAATTWGVEEVIPTTTGTKEVVW